MTPWSVSCPGARDHVNRPLVMQIQRQAILNGQFGLNGRVSWLTDGALYFICKLETEDLSCFEVNFPNFKEESNSLLSNLRNKIIRSNLCNLAQQETLQLLCGSLPLPFVNLSNTLIIRFNSSPLPKICKTQAKLLRQLEVPWSTRI